MRVTSLGYRTDLALRALEGGTETDRGGCLVVRNPALPDFCWGSFLLLAWPRGRDSAPARPGRRAGSRPRGRIPNPVISRRAAAAWAYAARTANPVRSWPA